MNNLSTGKIVFPRDEGDKDTPFDWWYLTSHFTTETKKKFSYTVVYISNGPKYCIRQTSITDELRKKYFWELMDGTIISKKNLLNLTYLNTNGDRDYWYQKNDLLFSYILSTEISNHFRLNICLTANKSPLVHGDKGLIHVGNGGDSFYYSLTNLALSGTFTCDGITETIQGVAWIDRQWGSWDTKGYDGWEWFALQLNDNTEIMLYLFFDFLREKRITPALDIMFSDGTSVNLNDSKMFTLKKLDYWEVKNPGFIGCLQTIFAKSYFSSGWRLTIPRYDIDLTIIPIIKNQRIDQSSWEGSCRVIGKHNGIKINSVSTVELTHLYIYPIQVRWIKNSLRRLELTPLIQPRKVQVFT